MVDLPNNNFDIRNLDANPDFDFINLCKINSNDENFFSAQGDNPYELSKFNCMYSGPLNYTIEKTSSNLSLMSINLQSINSKFSELCELIAALVKNNSEPDIICVQELWQFPSDANFSIPGFHDLIYKLRRNNVQGGGVGIYIKSCFNYSLNSTSSVFVDRIFESIFVDVSIKNKNVLVGSLYRPAVNHPDLNVTQQFDQFLDLFNTLLSDLSNAKMDIFMLGDLNIDLLKFNSCNKTMQYIDTLFSYGFLQVITKPTRCTNTSATLIDHCITNVISDTHDSTILTCMLSDHFPYIYNHSCQKAPVLKKPSQTRDFSQENINKFREMLAGINWSFVNTTQCPQEAYNLFSDFFNNMFELYFPLKLKHHNKNFNKIEKWCTSGILTSRRNKLILSNISARSPSAANSAKFKLYRNTYNKVIKLAKKLYFENELSLYQSDLKKTWSLICLAINRKPKNKSNNVSSMRINNIDVTDSSVIANSFNEFFATAPALIVGEISPTDVDFQLNPNDPDPDFPLFSFSNTPVSETEIIDAIKLLQPKKSCDLNGLSMFFLKHYLNEIIKPLHHVISSSLRAGVVPSQLKIAKIVPIFKSGNMAAMDNYRPIALLNNFSKIIEKVVCIRLYSYLESNNILSGAQFGFRQGHSTVHPMVHFLNYISNAFEKKHHVLAIFCDLRKAFDTVDSGILLKKLYKMGVRGPELNWFKSYLTDRKQFVCVNGKHSSLKNIKIGVPQGSILGPLLFLIYINDLPLATLLYPLLFADDTTLLASGPDIDLLFDFVNSELKKIAYFFRLNKLALHPNKTNFILFSNSLVARNTDRVLFIDNNNPNCVYNPNLLVPLTRVNGSDDNPTVKFLGIYIDPLLTFKHHVQIISKKISSSLYFLRAAKNVLSKKALTTVYYSLIHSHLIYAIQIWSCCSTSIINKLFVKQKNALRIINNSSYNAHTESLFKNCKILPLPKLIDFFKLQFMFHYVQGFLPTSFAETWLTNEARRRHLEENANLTNYRLRNDDDIFIPPARLSSTERLPMVCFPRLWSQFDKHDIKIQRNKNAFNSMLRNHFLDQLQSNFICERLLCPHCLLKR